MDDVVKVIFVIFGLFLGVVFFIAQCQLFAIRRLLEDLVRQGGGVFARDRRSSALIFRRADKAAL